METYHYSNIDEELDELYYQSTFDLICNSCNKKSIHKEPSSTYYCSNCGDEMTINIDIYNELQLNYNELTEEEKKVISTLEEKYSVILAQ